MGSYTASEWVAIGGDQVDLDAKPAALFRQIDYVAELVGCEPYYYPEGIETPDKLGNLTAALLRRGFSKTDIEKVLGLNWLRVYRKIWG